MPGKDYDKDDELFSKLYSDLGLLRTHLMFQLSQSISIKKCSKKVFSTFICTRIYLFGKVKIDWDIFLLLFQQREETLWSQPTTTAVDTAPAGTNQIHKY